MAGMSPRMFQVLKEERYVTRLKEHMPDKFREMCYMHLSFILNLSDDKLERILSGDEKSSTRRRLALSSINPIFKKKDMCKEGVFRKAGNRQRMRTLRETLNEMGHGLVIDASVYNTHDVCGVFKEFLRELPEPLLTERHMEAHMQIAVLGSHAQTPEECARYTHKKISALQLLMQLLPSATRQMIMDVLTLLHNIALIPETRMTPESLATIFAPIFFFNKKVSPLDMCDVLKVVEPALAFMISNVHKMFKVPRELAVDIKVYCKSIEGCDDEAAQADPAKVSQAYKIRKSISGRTLNTAVCYIDREQANTQDSTSTTQSELENLFAHINSLPDTPSNRRYKEMVSKASCTPDSSAKAHRRSKSIGASLKKHLPSLSKTKAKSLDTATQGNATPYCDILQRSKVGHHRVNSDSQVMVVNCTSAEKRDRYLQAVIDKKGSPNDTAMLNLLQSSGLRLSETTRTIAESMMMFSSSSHMTLDKSPFQRRKRHSSEDAASFECTPPKRDCPDQSVNKLSTLASPPIGDKSGEDLRTPSFSMQREPPKSISKLPFSQAKENSMNIQTPEEIKGKICTAAAAVPGLENEITYLPFQSTNRSSLLPPSECDNPTQSVKARRPLRPCNTPGTPIMPRSLRLQLAHSITLETSI